MSCPWPCLNNNILIKLSLGLPKKCQKFYFFKITKVPEFRQRLSFIVPMITTCNQTHEDREAIRNRYRKPDRLHMGSVNISFSWKGLQKVKHSLTDHRKLPDAI